MTDPVSFGLFDIMQVDRAVPTGESLAAHLAIMREADRLGLEYIFISERHFMPAYRAATPGLILAQLAATTERARLGVMAWTLALHNPVLLAEQISALDHLSGGRLEVGAGLGHRPVEIDTLGIPSEHRHAIFLECATVMQQLWQGQPVTYDGALYRLRDAWVDPPLQQPHPPLWYAGGDPRAAAWAGTRGWSLALGFQPDAALRAPSDAFHAAKTGDSARLAVMRHIYVAESDDAAREEVTADLVRVAQHLADNPQLAEGRAATPLTPDGANAIFDRQQERQAVIAGGPETIAWLIAETMRTLRADVFLAAIHLSGVDDARLRATLRRYAEQVVPHVRELLAAG